MANDEQAIRGLVDTWLAATKKRDLETVLKLMTEDVILMVPGQEPFGKEGFAATFREMKNVHLEATSEIQEIKVLGDWAWMRNRLKVTVTPLNGWRVTESVTRPLILNLGVGGVGATGSGALGINDVERRMTT